MTRCLVITSHEQSAETHDNVATDIGETKNLTARQPEILRRLDTMRKTWAADLIKPRFKRLIHTEAFQQGHEKAKEKKN